MDDTKPLRLSLLIALVVACPGITSAQLADPATRQAAIEQAQAEKAKELRPYLPGKAERLITRIDTALGGGKRGWHPFLDSAYRGGGFAYGAGYVRYLSSYNTIDVRGSFTWIGYKRVEAEFRAPRLFERRGDLSILGGWREATQVGFYGLGSASSKTDRTNYGFQEPFASA